MLPKEFRKEGTTFPLKPLFVDSSEGRNFSPSIAKPLTNGILTLIQMEPSTSQTKALADRPIKELIEEAAREAAEKVRSRNKRMGWPIVVSEPKPASESAKP